MLTIVALAVQRASINELVKEVRTTFWKVEDVSLSKSDRKFIYGTLKKMKLKLFALAGLGVIYTVVMFVPMFLTDEKALPFPQYQPSWMSINEILLLKLFVLIFALDISVVALISLVMTFVTLTHMQFRLLNRQIENSLNMDNGPSHNVIKRIVDHHNFLLRWVIIIH